MASDCVKAREDRYCAQFQSRPSYSLSSNVLFILGLMDLVWGVLHTSSYTGLEGSISNPSRGIKGR
jgi:hypothetical protein